MRGLLVWAVIALASTLPPLLAQGNRACVQPGNSALPEILPALSGRWDLALYTSKGKRAQFSLELLATDSAQRIGPSIIDHSPRYDAGYLYFGGLTGDSVEVDARAGKPWDPDRPPVKVRFEHTSMRALNMSVGSEQNDRTRVIMDGWTFWLNVRHLENGFMTGVYSRGVWVIERIDSGWWCARRR